MINNVMVFHLLVFPGNGTLSPQSGILQSRLPILPFLHRCIFPNTVETHRCRQTDSPVLRAVHTVQRSGATDKTKTALLLNSLMPYIVANLLLCVSSLWCPSILQCPSIRPGNLAAFHIPKVLIFLRLFPYLAPPHYFLLIVHAVQRPYLFAQVELMNLSVPYAIIHSLPPIRHYRRPVRSNYPDDCLPPMTPLFSDMSTINTSLPPHTNRRKR